MDADRAQYITAGGGAGAPNFPETTTFVNRDGDVGGAVGSGVGYGVGATKDKKEKEQQEKAATKAKETAQK